MNGKLVICAVTATFAAINAGQAQVRGRGTAAVVGTACWGRDHPKGLALNDERGRATVLPYQC
jgi:hypothetical protein